MLKKNEYGDRVVKEYAVSIVAATMDEAIQKTRAMAGATYDDFRRFWSHDLRVNSIEEVEEPPQIVPASPDSETGI
jgi:3-oxoacyl-[acyl-carrier-protein] synthase III